jgi:hypothetical protein
MLPCLPRFLLTDDDHLLHNVSDSVSWRSGDRHQFGMNDFLRRNPHGRVMEVQHWNYHWLTGLLTEDSGQRVNYSYDTDLLSGNQEYARGRLTEVTFGGGLGGNFYYRYSYNGGGASGAGEVRGPQPAVRHELQLGQ